MMIKLALLVAIAWLLWLIREELVQMGERQRNLKSILERLVERVEQLPRGDGRPGSGDDG